MMEQMVREFMKKHRFPADVVLGEQHSAYTNALLNYDHGKLSAMAIDMEQCIDLEESDYRCLRAHLMVEELGEAFKAMADRDEVALADALTDLLYVTVGTMATYGLPVDALFAEIQRSNMTKLERCEGDPRLRQKGSGYEKPKIAEIIARSRGEIE